MGERQFQHIGTRPARHDGVDKVTGRAAYGADFSLPGLLYGAVLRSPHAHARIVSIDTGAAEAVPGVKAVITARDIPANSAKVLLGGEASLDLGDMSDCMLAREKVLYHGHAVAAVAATSLEIAREAASRIDVKYERLPPVTGIDQAIAPGAPLLDQSFANNIANRMEFKRGDVARGFDEADVVIEREFRTPMVHQGYIEPHACVARHGQAGRVTIWCTTQGPFVVRDACAGILGIDAARIKVIPSEIGGGFGGKIVVYIEPLAAVLSRKANRP